MLEGGAAPRQAGADRRRGHGRCRCLGLAAARRRHGDERDRDDPDGRDGRLADAAGGVERRLCRADVRHVVGDDGGDDAAQRGADAAAVRPRQPQGQSGRPAAGLDRPVAAGYLLVWGGFSAAAVALQWGLEVARLLSPMMETTTVWLGAGILIAAGLWQLTPIKAVCLRHCRTPLGFLIGHWRAGRLRRAPHGAGARRLVPRLLLGPDGAAVLWRRNEPVLDRRAGGLRPAGEDHPARPLAWQGCGHCAGRLWRVAACTGAGVGFRIMRKTAPPSMAMHWLNLQRCSTNQSRAAPLAAAKSLT